MVLSVTQATNVLIEGNYIHSSPRSLIDIEPYIYPWDIQYVRIVGNQLGACGFRTITMGGGGTLGPVYVADNVIFATPGLSSPFYEVGSEDYRRGPFVAVNNQLLVGPGRPSSFLHLLEEAWSAIVVEFHEP